MTQATPSMETNEFYRDLTQAGMSARKAEVVAKYSDELGRAKTPAKLRVMTREYVEAMTQAGFTERQAKLIAEMRAETVRHFIKPTWLHALFGGNKMTTSAIFHSQLQSEFSRAEKQGKSHVDINSGDLHGAVGDYPGKNHRMPVCCEVMYNEMKTSDEVIAAPPKGKGASLTIRYKLPR